MKHISLDQLSAQQFTDVLHTTFQVLLENGSAIPLELTSITQQHPSRSQFESFSLLFNGPADRPLAQRTYRFSHERLGAFDLFIVPIGADATGRQYEAAFNRRSWQENV